jgi:hypothetical protein
MMNNLCADVACREWDARRRRAPPAGHDSVILRLHVSETLTPHRGALPAATRCESVGSVALRSRCCACSLLLRAAQHARRVRLKLAPRRCARALRVALRAATVLAR